MGGYTDKQHYPERSPVVICLQISNFEWVDTPLNSDDSAGLAL